MSIETILLIIGQIFDLIMQFLDLVSRIVPQG